MGRAVQQSWRKAAAGGLLVAGLAFLLAWIDPFGLESDSEKFSADLAQYVSSPFYGRGFGGGSPVGQDRITVVYLDEDSLEKLYPMWTGFPPSYASQAQLLGDVLGGAGEGRRPPRAVFVDFSFLSKGRFPDEFMAFARLIGDATRADAWKARAVCDNDEVVKLACILDAGGTPVILGNDKPAQSPPSEDGRQTLRAVAVLASLNVEERSYPLLAPEDPGDSPAALLYVADRLAGIRCGPGGTRSEPYRRLRCAVEDYLHRGGPSEDVRAAAQAVRKSLGGRFAVRWSSRPDTAKPGVNQLSEAMTGRPSTCDGADRGGLVYSWGDATGRLAGRITGLRIVRADETRPERRPACPYALSIPYGAWVTGPSLPPSLLSRLFEDRLVLIGGHFSNSSDWIATPVHGQLPGVQYHAMALDNLLEVRDPRGATVMPRIDGLTPLLSRFWSALLLFILVTIGGIHYIERNDLRRELDAAGAGRRASAWRMLGLYGRFLAVDLLILFLCVVLAGLLHMPLNWIAVGAIALGHTLWSVRETLGEDLGPLYRRGPLTSLPRRLAASLSLRGETLREPPPPPTPTPDPSPAASEAIP